MNVSSNDSKRPTSLVASRHSVLSRDGTQICYRSIGQGPGIVILHGSMESANSHTELAAALADEFTVYLPDRRGHGDSGPAGDNYDIGTEVDDLDALLRETQAENLFGVSSSGLIALEAARRLRSIKRVAVYEPALLLGDPARTAWLPRFERELAQGQVSAAMITSMKGLKLAPPIVNLMPRSLLIRVTEKAIRAEDRTAEPGRVTMRHLAPTLRYEGRLIREMDGRLDTFTDVQSRVLLMGGSKGLRYLKPALAALARVLPDCERVEFPGLDHGGSSDVSKINRRGGADVVAPVMRRFFAEP